MQIVVAFLFLGILVAVVLLDAWASATQRLTVSDVISEWNTRYPLLGAIIGGVVVHLLRGK
jgi:hypothetical protein